MREIYKNTFAYILLIVGLIIFSHSIIPHDHHYTEVCETEHDTHQGHEDATNDPIHCHFLNDIIISKAISNINLNSINNLLLLFITIYQNDEIDDNQSLTIIRFLDDDGLPDRQTFIDVSPSRGSPVLA